MTEFLQSELSIATEDDLLRARYSARMLASRAGLDERAEVRLLTIVSELGRNTLKYAGEGSCSFSIEHLSDHRGVVCTFEDNGPGIGDLDAALADGYSTGGTLGVGLPGVRRLADKFRIETSSSGTTVVARVYAKTNEKTQSVSSCEVFDEMIKDPARVGISIRPFDDGRFSGDQAGVWVDPEFIVICMIDGLGHGEAAEFSARRALECIAGHRDRGIDSIMRRCDRALSGSRGAAIGLAKIDRDAAQLEYLSVGNTRCALVSDSVRYLGGGYGVVGEGPQIAMPELHPLAPRDVLILWTDGLPETLPIVAHRVRGGGNAQNMAAQLVDDFAVDGDDAGVVVFNWEHSIGAW